VAMSTLIQIVAAALGVIGSLFFTIGIVRQSPATMAALAGSYFDFDPHAVPTLAAQKTDYLFGGAFIVLAFAPQTGSFLAGPSTIAVGAKWTTLIAILATIVAFLALYRASRLLASLYEGQIRKAIAKAEAEAAAAGRGIDRRTVSAPGHRTVLQSPGIAEFAHQDQPEHDQQQRHQQPQQRTATRIRLFRNRRLAPLHQRHHALPHIENQLAGPPEARRVCATGYSPFSRAIFSIAATLCVCVRCE
jgi:hypothetical protein